MYHTDGNTGCIQTTDFSIMYKPVKKKLPGNKKINKLQMFGKTCIRWVGAPSFSHMYRAASGEQPPTTGPTTDLS